MAYYRKPFSIQIKKSKKTGQWYYVTYHGNGRKLTHSETIKNTTHLANLMKQYKQMGYVIDYGQFKTKNK